MAEKVQIYTVVFTLLFITLLLLTGCGEQPYEPQVIRLSQADTTWLRPMVEAHGLYEESTVGVDSSYSEDVLWLARAIFSETKQAHEQRLVAWSIRNRMETRYRGKSTYKDTVLDPWQYSAFNSNNPKRRYHIALSSESKAKGWRTALHIARTVISSPESARPFGRKVRHFYSERSMLGETKIPTWAVGQDPINIINIEPERFRFFHNIP